LTKAAIYHNPKCSKSRDALRFLSDSGIEATIVLYLEAGWTAELLQELKGSSGLDWKHMLRPDAQSDLEDALAENDSGTIIQYLIDRPDGLERPFVVTGKGTRLCRPLEAIFEITDRRPQAPWLTEKGVKVV